MFAYYLDLALRSFRRNKALTALMVLAIALGIGASMTTLTVFHVLSGDPIPQKSDKLFFVQMDPAGNIKPDKGRSREKIDGIVALCMALFGAMADGGDGYTQGTVQWA